MVCNEFWVFEMEEGIGLHYAFDCGLGNPSNWGRMKEDLNLNRLLSQAAQLIHQISSNEIEED